ncbi:rhodanese-like domain-containing protein [Pseudonocardia sp. WMMC193]|uniref:rhodanese-like domain-containing protein n=1 Tax=Pseudonocardia sp. WMMC193 TaxID=2911965 RepID=UPI001F253A8F|nr:rhodanese-like domain-containing protein [Pseudonocardia sp. WMMC193]MCF7552654.1 rhodanese-like domain-containing protein [Pseudonocardia sp. WMMC193]
MPSSTLHDQTTVAALRAALSTTEGPVLLDVRTPGEFRTGSIAGALNVPVDQIEQHSRQIADRAARSLVMICQSGGRATRAAGMLAAAGAENVSVLDGGMNAWHTADAPVETRTSTTWVLERQVRLVAGGIVATSVLGSIWAPKLRFVAGGIGAGLVFAAVSNTCAMGTVLSKLPFNRAATADVRGALDTIGR